MNEFLRNMIYFLIMKNAISVSKTSAHSFMSFETEVIFPKIMFINILV
jgi:hypothetical protein